MSARTTAATSGLATRHTLCDDGEDLARHARAFVDGHLRVGRAR